MPIGKDDGVENSFFPSKPEQNLGILTGTIVLDRIDNPIILRNLFRIPGGIEENCVP